GTPGHRTIMIEAIESQQLQHETRRTLKQIIDYVLAVPPFASSSMTTPSSLEPLARDIKRWGAELGFQQVGIAGCELGEAETRRLEGRGRGYQGGRGYGAPRGTRRARPADLVPGTLRVIAARMNYLPSAVRDSWEVLGDGGRAYVSRYALGRDY